LFESSKVKVVQVTGAGVDRLDEAAMKKLSIPVANVPGGSNSAVAEYAVGCTIALLRRMAWADMEIRDANYVSFRGRMLADNLPGLEGLTVGVVGLGTVGYAVAEAFRRFGCEIAYFDPTPRDEAAAKIGAKALPLDELLKVSDVVTVHVPLLPTTRSMIGARQLNLMKPGAVLIQASRGGIVHETALAAVLNSGRLGGAAVDVYSVEPPDTDNPLFALEGEAAHRVLFTPHIAGVTRQASATLFREAWANVERVLKGEAPLNRVY
jgi:phosphoglycerate dehydrogenase-like enzyme